MIGSAQEAAAILRSSRCVGVCGHERPDGDSLGSVAALVYALRAKGITAHAYGRTRVPSYYGALGALFDAAALLPETDLLVCVDFTEEERADISLTEYSEDLPRLFIDHHPTDRHLSRENVYYFHDATAAASACLVRDVIAALDVPLTSEIAEALYIGLSTDTGNFTYSNTNRRACEILTEIVDAGVDITTIACALRDNWRFTRMRLLRSALDTVTEVAGGRAAYMYVTPEMFSAADADAEDAIDFVNFVRALAHVDVAAALTEEPESACVRINLRSKDSAHDVRALAEHFGGGGHTCASGARVSGTLADFLPVFAAALDEYMR